MDLNSIFSDLQREGKHNQHANVTGYQIFTGVVITSTAATYTATVVRDGYMGGTADGGNMIQGILISTQFASFLGFREVSIPQPGARVLCVSVTHNTCYIVGIIPQNNLSSEFVAARTNLGPGDSIADDANATGHQKNLPVMPGNRRPSDVVDGEYALVNDFGVLLGLFQQLVVLKASELAQVQCFLLDDLVRVISHNYQHYSALGEMNISHDGKSIMCEFGATHLPAETYGRPCTSNEQGAPVFADDSGPTKDDNSDYVKITEDERIKGIERFKMFLGRLGDFMHLYLVRPDENEVRSLNPENKPTKPDTGLLDVHIGTEGGLHVRSVREVFLEKTNWIRVPHRFSAPEDQKGDDATNIDYEDKTPFDWDKTYQYQGNPMAYFLQLRDYVAYTSEKNAYRNFKKHEKDFFVNDTPGQEKNLKEITQVDKNTQLEQQSYELRTSGVYLMPNGGIVFKDAWNSAIVMEGGNIYFQPAKDLIMQPMRNFVAKVGGWTSISGKKDIDLSSTEGGFRLKTDKSQYYYSDNAGIVLEAHNAGGGTGSPDPQSEAIQNINGIVLKSDKGIYSYAKTEIVQYSTTSMVLQSAQNIFVEADGLLGLSTKGTAVMHANNLICDGVGSALFLSSTGGAVFAGKGSSAFGEKDIYLGVQYDTKSPFVDPLKGAVPLEELIPQLAKVYPQLDNPLKNTVFTAVEKFTNLQFKFLASDRYGSLDGQTDAIPATMSQQDDKLTSLYGFSAWQEKEVNSTLPFPGKDKFDNFYLDSEAPKNLESNPSGKSYSSKADSQESPATLTLKSLMEYKIQT